MSPMPSPAPAATVVSTAMDVDDDSEDPLDAFMQGLYGGGGDVPAAQKELKPVDSNSNEFDLNEDVGSNFITLDQIMGIGGSTAVDRRKSSSAGWESDSNFETEEQEEEREEQERKQFRQANRKAREAEEVQIEKAAKKEESDSKSLATFGRVFGYEGL